MSLENLTVQSRSLDGFLLPNTFCNYHLRPRFGWDKSSELKITPEDYKREIQTIEGFSDILQELKQKLDRKIRSSYPKIIFLGTGSCIPNKTRNTSGILLQTK